MTKTVSFLRAISLAEGVSYLTLLGVAMPLKYLAGLPLAVRIVGSIHGGLFVALCVALALALYQARWPVARAALVFTASLIPFAPFFLDQKMRVWASDFLEERA